MTVEQPRGEFGPGTAELSMGINRVRQLPVPSG